MSTKEVLSDDEIEALMDTVEDRPTDPAALDDNGEHRAYDFAANDGTLIGQLPVIKTINDKVCIELEKTLMRSFKMPFDVDIESVEVLKVDEFMKSLSEFSAINMLKFDITNGLSLAVLGGGLLSEVINRYFGSSFNGTSLPQKERALTPTEARMNERVLSHLLAALQAGWEKVTPLQVKLITTETNPEFIKIGSSSDMGVRFTFKLSLGEFSDSIHWLLPYAAIESLRTKLSTLARPLLDEKNKQNWSRMLHQQVSSIELDLTAVFATLELSLNEVLNLKKGTILPVRVPDQVEVHSGGIPMFSGEYGCFDSNKAISVKQKFQNVSA